ncbi:MAG: maleylpyruvate isomerase family mycothiol-dependent enzyme [Thermoflexales bacterium]|nr:maleylpyruvate isomerase family mycothiol-dependent enzyme [Thermoflexales bacterium]
MEIQGETYRIAYDPDTSTLRLQGKLRLLRTPLYEPLVRLLDELVDSKPQALTLDLQALKFINSSGIDLLIHFILKLHKKTNCQLTMRGSVQEKWHRGLLNNLQRFAPAVRLAIEDETTATLKRQAGPIIVIDLFPEILDKLVELLSGLPANDWKKPTACHGWSVKDLALHLLGDDVSLLSRKRDGYSTGAPVQDWDELVSLVNDLNTKWVEGTRRLSPRLTCELLKMTGTQVYDYLRSLDMHATGDAVSWAGPEPAPVWLDVAREYTERWLHQQHIRDAVARPGLKQSWYLAPVLDTFVRALPHTYREIQAADGTLVVLTISGSSGGRWFLLREDEQWRLYLDDPRPANAEVIIDEEIAWRLFTRTMSKDEARSKIAMLGDQALGLPVLDMVSIIA